MNPPFAAMNGNPNRILLVSALALWAGVASSTATAQLVGGGWQVRGHFEGDLEEERFGQALTGVGDVDGDGADDFAIGVPAADGTVLAGAGRVDVISGATGQVLQSYEGVASFRDFGFAVAGPGDLDGDTIPDIVIGARFEGVGPNPAAGVVRAYSHASGLELYRLDGQGFRDWFGYAVSSGPDANGDGIGDILVGAPRATAGGAAEVGEALLFSGADGSFLRSWAGEVDGDFFGGAVALVEDLDGDALADVVVGAPLTELLETPLAGVVEVYSGSTGARIHRFEGGAGGKLGFFVSDAHDVDGDGFTDILIAEPYGESGGLRPGLASLHSGATGALLQQWVGEADGDNFGWGVAGVRDVSCDGVPDLLVGARFHAAGGLTAAGRAYLYSGADYSLLRTFDGAAAGSWYGYSVADAGDTNADGFHDFLVGSPFSDPGGTRNSGEVDLHGYDPYLLSDTQTLSLAAGATILWTVAFPLSEAGKDYAMLASATGTGPSDLNGLQVPLTQDFLFSLFLTGSAPPLFTRAYGILDANGMATIEATAPPGLTIATQTYWFAVVTYDPPSSTRVSSAAVALDVVP